MSFERGRAAMFAPPVKAPKAKTAPSVVPIRAPKQPQYMPWPGVGLSNQAMLRYLAADLQTREANRGQIATKKCEPNSKSDPVSQKSTPERTNGYTPGVVEQVL